MNLRSTGLLLISLPWLVHCTAQDREFDPAAGGTGSLTGGIGGTSSLGGSSAVDAGSDGGAPAGGGSAGAGGNGGECTPNARQCSEAGRPQLCNEGTWEPQDPCGDKETCSAGVCNCEETVCGESCVDLTNDPDHCGACGHSCQGGACEDSKCQPVVLAPDTRVDGLALGGGFVYWNSGASIERVSVNGGEASTVVESSAHYIYESSVVLADAFVFWSQGTSETENGIYRKGLEDASKAVSVGPDQAGEMTFVSGLNQVVYHRRYQTPEYIARISLDGSEMTVLTNVAGGRNLATDTTHAYYDTTVDGESEIRKVHLTTKGTLLLHTVSESVDDLAVDGAYVYYASGGRLGRVPTTGGAAEPHAVHIDGFYRILVDADTVYFTVTQYGGMGVCLGVTVWKTSADMMGPMIQLASEDGCSEHLVQDADSIYWGSQRGGQVVKLAK